MSNESRIYAAVALGGAMGAVCRFLISAGSVAWLGADFPFGTMAANLAGSFLIGLYMAAAAPQGGGTQGAAAGHFVTTGFCGGFTTFSIFSLETLLLVEEEKTALAALYLSSSVIGWLLAVQAGLSLGRRLKPRPAR